MAAMASEARGLVLAKLVDATKIDGGDATRRHLTTGPISDLRKAYREGGVRFGGCDRRREKAVLPPATTTSQSTMAAAASRSRRRAGQGATCEHQQQGEDEPPHVACVNTCAGPRKAGASTGTYTVVST